MPESILMSLPSDANLFMVCRRAPLNQEKKEEIWLGPMTKAIIPTEMSNGQSDSTKNVIKKFDYTVLQTNLGRSVRVTTANQLVWFTGLRAQLSHSPKQSCNQNDTHLKI